MKRFYLIRLTKIAAGLILAALTIAVCGVAVVLMHDLTPLYAKKLAEQTESQRDRDFFAPLRLSSITLPLEACPGLSAVPPLIQTAHKYSWLQHFTASWHPVCRLDFGYFADDFDAFNLGLTRRWCDDLQNRIGLLSNAGDTCDVLEGQGGSYLAGGDRDRNDYDKGHSKDVFSVRMTLSRDSRNHSIGTFWVSTKRQSWGHYLVAEYVSELLFLEATLMVLLASTFAILFLTVRRFITKSKARPHNSPRPWIEILLETVGLDHDHQVGDMIQLLSQRHTGCAKVVQWLLFLLWEDRISYYARRSVQLIGRGVESVWKRQRKVS